ncbi:MAG: alpha-2-macroglobulin family protein [Flavobacteriales bacterium]
MKKITLFALFSVLIMSSCKDKEGFVIDPEFAKYVSAFTYGVVSNQSTIKVQLVQEVAAAKAGEEVKEDVLEFSPAIEGKAYWLDKQTIEFKPKELLPSGEQFEAEFHLSEIVKEAPEKLENLEFNFRVISQIAFVEEEALITTDPKNRSAVRLKGSVTTADYVKPDVMEKIFSAEQKDQQLNIQWEHNKDGRNHTYYINNARRGNDRSKISLHCKMKEVGAEENAEKEVIIPSLNEFTVFSCKHINEPEQIITLNFSDPVKDSLDLNGLIYIKNSSEVRLTTKGSLVKIYPASRIVGEFELVAKQGICSNFNTCLKEDFVKKILFAELNPAVEIIGNGVILPSTKGLVLPFRAVNLKAVELKILKVAEKNVHQFFQKNQFDEMHELKRVGRIVYRGEVPIVPEKPINYHSWNTFSLDLSKYIQSEPGAIYRIYLSFKPQHSFYPCQEVVDADYWKRYEEAEEEFYDRPNSGYWDDYDFNDFQFYEGYEDSERDNPCHISYYITRQNKNVRSIFASNFGIIAKGGNTDEILVAVSDLRTTEPLDGVDIELYNYQNELITSATTDGDGFVSIKTKRKPFLLVAKKGSERGYLRLDEGSSLSLSMFDVSGTENKKGVKGYIYTERGVWRPGDSVYVNFVLEDKNDVLPADHPVVCEIYNARDQLYKKTMKNTSVNGLYDFRFATNEEDPTGNWTAKIKVGGNEFSKILKIETVKPNRLKINMDFGTELLKSKGDNSGNLEVKWLHGAKARNLMADVEMTMKRATTSFKGYEGYEFDDPTIYFESEQKMIFKGKLDGEGKASVDPEIKIEGDAPGMLSCFFKTRAFESGGDFSTDQFKVLYSPFSSYVGVKVPEGKGWNGALFSDKPNMISIASVDENNRPVSRDKMKIEIYEIEWRWWWDYSEDEGYGDYHSSSYKNLIKTDYVSTKNGKALYELTFPSASWGRKMIKITDPVSGHTSGKIFYTTYSSWWEEGGHGPGGAEMLAFSTNKTKYNVGEKVSVQLPKVKEGRALVTIETGSKIIDHFWHELSGNTFEFTTTEAMAPNVFVHVTLIQPHNSTANDVPIRMYGVQSISVEDAKTHLVPQIKMPEVLAPEQNVNITVSEKNGRKMAYTVAVVDEGLLDLTRFKTPDAWPVFYSKEALGIKTWDMYKYVIGAYNGQMMGLLAAGGDEAAASKAGGEKTNRFKPAVIFLGPFYLEPGQTKTHKFKMPNYVGSVRTMVVACDNGAYGSAEKTTPVKKPLMVISTLPRVLGPKEIVKVPVTVFAMDKKVKDVEVSIKPSAIFKVIGGATKKIHFSEEGDQIVEFELQVAEAVGKGKIEIVATGAGEKSNDITDIEVRCSNPMMSKVISETVNPGQSVKNSYSVFGLQGTNKVTLEFSTIPSMNLDERLQYLIQYPHGCIEQTTSSVFPQLFLGGLLNLTDKEKETIRMNIEAGITRLRTFQLADGGMSYWPQYGYSDASHWGTNYAGHFMMEAEKQGYTLPAGFKEKWISFQSEAANSWSNSSYYDYDEITQAYRLYTLALAGAPELGAMNRLKEMTGLHNEAKWRLAAAYHLAGKEKIALSMVQNISYDVRDYNELGGSYGSSLRDLSMILESMTYLNMNDKGKKVLDDICRLMRTDNWYSTQTTAYSLLAACKFVNKMGSSKGIEVDYKIAGGPVKTISITNPISKVEIDANKIRSGEIEIINKGKGVLFTKLYVRGVPLMGEETAQSNSISMDITYTDFNGNTIDPSSLPQGTDFVATVKITNTSYGGDLEEMALTQIFPSGWEIRNTRMDLAETDETASNFESVTDTYEESEEYYNDSAEERNKRRNQAEYIDFRDDRVLTYFDMNYRGSMTFKVVLHAAYQGQFYMPAVYCEAMYDHDINASSAGQWVKVTK